VGASVFVGVDRTIDAAAHSSTGGSDESTEPFSTWATVVRQQQSTELWQVPQSAWPECNALRLSAGCVCASGTCVAPQRAGWE
jgi:hypothetical protein